MNFNLAGDNYTKYVFLSSDFQADNKKSVSGKEILEAFKTYKKLKDPDSLIGYFVKDSCFRISDSFFSNSRFAILYIFCYDSAISNRWQSMSTPFTLTLGYRRAILRHNILENSQSLILKRTGADQAV